TPAQGETPKRGMDIAIVVLIGTMRGPEPLDGGQRFREPSAILIAVAEGQEVKSGEMLAIAEAMKMENVLRAERDATVKKIHVKPGESLAVDAVILEFA